MVADDPLLAAIRPALDDLAASHPAPLQLQTYEHGYLLRAPDGTGVGVPTDWMNFRS